MRKERKKERKIVILNVQLHNIRIVLQKATEYTEQNGHFATKYSLSNRKSVDSYFLLSQVMSMIIFNTKSINARHSL